MKKNLPLDEMLLKKGNEFKILFVKTMNLYLGSHVGAPISEKDKSARVRKQIEESLKKGE
jgi:hypothetical protein